MIINKLSDIDKQKDYFWLTNDSKTHWNINISSSGPVKGSEIISKKESFRDHIIIEGNDSAYAIAGLINKMFESFRFKP